MKRPIHLQGDARRQAAHARPSPFRLAACGVAVAGCLVPLLGSAQERLSLWGEASGRSVVLSDPVLLSRPGPPTDPLPASARRSARINQLPVLLGLPEVLPVAEGKADEGAVPPLSLMGSMALGVDGSLEVLAAGARRQSFEHTRSAAVGAFLPRLDARGGTGKGRLESVQPWLTLPRRDASVVLKQTVFDVGALVEVGRQAKLAESARIQWEGAGSSAGLEVASAYLQALQSRITMELSREHEAMLVQLLEYVTERAKAGGTSNAERDRVKARVANARSAIADSRANLKAALRNLESLLGQVPETLAIGVPEALEIPELAEQARELAEQGNHDLRAARSDIDASNLEAQGYRARHLPRLDIELSQTRNLNASGTDSYQRDSKAMLVMNWSLLNGGIDQSQAGAAAARTREKQLREADARRKLGQEIDAAYATLDALHERFEAAREEFEANRRVVEAFRAQLVGGNRPLLDVLDADQRLYQSRLDLTQLAVGEVQNHIKVAHLVGRLPALLAASPARP